MAQCASVDENGYFHHHCEGCGFTHIVPVRGAAHRVLWGYNGNVDAPTLTPSVKHSWPRKDNSPDKVCHYFITDGRIAYCGDCTHALAGQTLPLTAS